MIEKFVTSKYSILLLIRLPFLQWKSGLIIRGVVCLEGNNLVVFYYPSASDIWPDKRSDLWLEWPYERGTTIHGQIQWGHTQRTHPLILEKIWFFGIKSWFFTRNTQKNFSPPSTRRNFFKCAPPQLEILDPLLL